ncbi:sulfotransferase family protein [Lacunimicrobium album]
MKRLERFVQRALVSGLTTRQLVQLRRRMGKHQLVVACFPKSGSTYLARNLAALKGWKESRYVPVFGRREQELDEACIRREMYRHPLTHQVSQLHVRCTDQTMTLARQFDLRFIVLYRNLYDCMVSVVDHWRQESCRGPMAFWTKQLLKDLESQGISQLEAASRTVAPWYINFYLSWIEHRQQFAHSSAFVSYEELFTQPQLKTAELLTELGITVSVEDFKTAQEQTIQTRFNQGVCGRGRVAFEKDAGARDAIDQLLRVYPRVDFSAILGGGLESVDSDRSDVSEAKTKAALTRIHCV